MTNESTDAPTPNRSAPEGLTLTGRRPYVPQFDLGPRRELYGRTVQLRDMINERTARANIEPWVRYLVTKEVRAALREAGAKEAR